jgi:hypothetical protein
MRAIKRPRKRSAQQEKERLSTNLCTCRVFVRWKKQANRPIFLRMSVALKLQKVDFRKLNARQKENHNFQKISGLLADYGFTAIRLSDDWNGADFLAQHVDGKTLLHVQLKSRLGIYKKYQGKNLWVCFPDRGDWYLYPHDVVLLHLLRTTNIKKRDSWRKGQAWSWKKPPRRITRYLKQFLLE